MPHKTRTYGKLRSAAEVIEERAAKGTLRPSRTPSASSPSPPSSSSSSSPSSKSSSAASKGSASSHFSSGHQAPPSRKGGHCLAPNVPKSPQSVVRSTLTAESSARGAAAPAQSASTSNQIVPAVVRNTGPVTSYAADAQLQADMAAELKKLEGDKEVIVDELRNLEIQIGKELRKRDRMLARDMKKG